MVIHNVSPKETHQLIKKMRCSPLKTGIFFSGGTHSINYIISFIISIDHTVNRINIILQICIHRNDHICILYCRSHTR